MTDDSVKKRDYFFKKVLTHDYNKGPLLVLAGPGTGKTFSLIKTLRTQMEKGIDLKTFYVTTLTNTAVGDLGLKIYKELKEDFDNVSTLHYRAKGIVHKYADKVRLNQSFTIINKPESWIILKDIQQKFLSNGEKMKMEEIKRMLKKYEEARASNEDIKSSNFSLYYEEFEKIYNAIDWFDVIYLACGILKENIEILEKEGLKQNFILVDEYQDLNPSEQNLIRLLCGDHFNLLVVGDDDQSIYSGRYADPSGIINFQRIYQNATKIPLPVSSRCPSAILKASYMLINYNDEKKRESKPELVALLETNKRAKGGYIASIGLKSEKAEAEFIGKAIEMIINQDKSRANNIMVLCANRKLGIELMNTIKKNYSGIPIHDNLSKNNTEEIQEELIVNYLKRFLSNHKDNLALRMILDLLVKVSAEKIAVILDKISRTGRSLWHTIHLEDIPGQLKNKEEAMGRFIKCVNASEKKNANEKLLIFAQEYPTLEESIQQLIEEDSKLEEIMKNEEPRSISPISITGVRFMTMHNAKGLDAGYIFIPFLEKEIQLPAKDIEEQRRLLYVAITRTMVAAIITWAWSRKSAARHKAGGGGYIKRTRSDFMEECGIINDTRQDKVLEALKQLSSLN